MTLEEFAQRWVDAGKPYNPPYNSPVIETDYTLSMIVYRDAKFQIELYLCKPNWSTPKHTHHFDSITIFNGGKMLGRRGIALDENPPWEALEDADIGIVQSILPMGHWHQIRATEQGFSFYNVQYWPEATPSSATIGYEGQSMGPIHQGIIDASK